METFKGIAFFIALLTFGAWLFRRNWLDAEIRRNESHDAPSDQQLRWHIRHLREDVHALVVINYSLLVVVAARCILQRLASQPLQCDWRGQTIYSTSRPDSGINLA